MSKIAKKKIAVLVSGSGSNLQSIIDNIKSGNLNCEISYVIADRKCYGAERAENYNICTVLVDRKEYGKNLSDRIGEVLRKDAEKKPDYIILAGFLSILSESFIEEWKGKIINIHPSLLPKYGGKGMYGMNVHRAVIEAGEKKSGATVHFVDNGIDTGEIIINTEVPVFEDDTPENLQERVLRKEHSLLTEAIKILLNR